MAKTDTIKPRSIKATNKDWERWQAVAAADGLPLSAWLRRLADKECRRVERAESNGNKHKRT